MDSGFRGLRLPLIANTQATTPAELAIGTFHHPSLGQQNKAFGIIEAQQHLENPAKGINNPTQWEPFGSLDFRPLDWDVGPGQLFTQ